MKYGEIVWVQFPLTRKRWQINLTNMHTNLRKNWFITLWDIDRNVEIISKHIMDNKRLSDDLITIKEITLLYFYVLMANT